MLFFSTGSAEEAGQVNSGCKRGQEVAPDPPGWSREPESCNSPPAATSGSLQKGIEVSLKHTYTYYLDQTVQPKDTEGLFYHQRSDYIALPLFATLRRTPCFFVLSITSTLCYFTWMCVCVCVSSSHLNNVMALSRKMPLIWTPCLEDTMMTSPQKSPLVLPRSLRGRLSWSLLH